MIKRSSDCIIDGRVSKDALVSCIKKHETTCARIERLRHYLKNEHAICDRERTANRPNNKLVHAFPRYITTMAAGYLIGSPVSYGDEKQAETLKAITDQYARINVQSIDMEIARNASAYGRAVEILYAENSAKPKPRCAALDPCAAFVVYDDTVETVPLFGVHYYRKVKNDGTDGAYLVNVYTDTLVEHYEVDSIEALKEAISASEDEHFFGGVPINEYWNDEDERGDFEPVTTLIDAYNTLQSDRINDKEQFVDAILILHGFTMEEDDEKRTPAQQIKEDRILMLPGENAGGDYLSNSLNEAETEILKNSIRDDVHKMSMVPDLTDKDFAGNPSRVTMGYKLFGFTQMIKNKERWFREALRDRLRMFAHFMSIKGNPDLDVDTVQITFSRSLPVNEDEIASMVNALHDIVPDELLLKQIPWIEDPKKALEMLKKQQEEETKRKADAFDQPMNTPNGKLTAEDNADG